MKEKLSEKYKRYRKEYHKRNGFDQWEFLKRHFNEGQNKLPFYSNKTL